MSTKPATNIESALEKANKLEADKQKEFDKITAKYQEQQKAIAADLKAEISRLNAELRAASRALDKIAGKAKGPLKVHAYGEENHTDIILGRYQDGQPHKNADVLAGVEVDKGSGGAIINGLKTRGFLEKVGHGFHKITIKGKEKVRAAAP
jgi:DNA repair exonuclease SbcCD ATPase subunit